MDISTGVATTFHYQTLFSGTVGQMGEGGPHEARAHNQIVVLLIHVYVLDIG